MDLLTLKENTVSNINELFTIHFNNEDKHTKELLKLTEHNNTLNGMIIKLTEEVKQKDKMLSIRDTTILEYENTIKDLKQENKEEEDIAERASMIRTLHKTISDHEKTIKTLKKDLEKVSVNKETVINEVINDKEPEKKEEIDMVLEEGLNEDDKVEDKVDDDKVEDKVDENNVEDKVEDKVVDDDENNVEDKVVDGDEDKVEDKVDDKVEDEEEVVDEEEKDYKVFTYNDVKYCIKNIIKPKKYYELTDTYEIGKEIGLFKYIKFKTNDCVSLIDCDDNVKYIFEKDEKYVIGKKIGYFDEGDKKRKLK